MSDKAQAARRSAEDQPAERVVIRDKRKIDSGGRGRHARPGEPDPVGTDSGDADKRPAGDAVESDAQTGTREDSGGQAAPGGTPAAPSGTHDAKEDAKSVGAPSSGGGLGAELEALRAELDERTRDLQRVTAEYANYRKRVDRDRGVAAELTTGTVLSALLPILDDLDRAREHGDLVGPFASVAEQLNTTLAKFGLTGFGEKGDPFDPTRHEAVAHLTSSEVTEPTCVDVMRRGYLLGERLLRPALVAVADPESTDK
jgi:molecular chaperone GrpE